MTFFNIVIPLYNAEKWLTRCLKTIMAQDYNNYRVIIINDCSTDNSKSVIESKIKENDKFTLISTPQNGGSLNSIKFGIDFADPRDEDIIVLLDGDDWLARPDVLTILNRAYAGNDCLMTYGSYIEYPANVRGKFSRQLPENVTKEKLFRGHTWATSHLKTFKYKLWKNIKKEDILDSNTNKPYSMAGDLCLMFPMLEMAEERSLFIEDILYVRNGSNPINEHYVDHTQQMRIEQEVRSKSIYPRLEEIQ
jgi:glycosyltransferase involved in cell wall biosynthesis